MTLASDSQPLDPRNGTEVVLPAGGTGARRARNANLIVGALMFGTLMAMAVVSLFWTPHDPSAVSVADRLAPPATPEHPLGTDQFGRDVLSQLMAGSRTSLYVGALGTMLALTIGLLLGAAGSIARGWIEEVVMRLSDLVLAFPAILVAIVLSAKLGPGNRSAIIAIIVWFTPTVTRLTRAGAHQIFARQFVLAARAYGKSRLYIFFRHVVPNISPTLIVQSTVMFALAILVEAALAFLGLGAQAPAPSWGRMLQDAQTFVHSEPLLAFWPGMAIALSVLGLNLLGDGLRDALDPKQRSRSR